jgi:hypothetical protein
MALLPKGLWPKRSTGGLIRLSDPLAQVEPDRGIDLYN